MFFQNVFRFPTPGQQIETFLFITLCPKESLSFRCEDFFQERDECCIDSSTYIKDCSIRSFLGEI